MQSKRDWESFLWFPEKNFRANRLAFLILFTTTSACNITHDNELSQSSEMFADTVCSFMGASQHQEMGQ